MLFRIGRRCVLARFVKAQNGPTRFGVEACKRFSHVIQVAYRDAVIFCTKEQQRYRRFARARSARPLLQRSGLCCLLRQIAMLTSQSPYWLCRHSRLPRERFSPLTQAVIGRFGGRVGGHSPDADL